MKKIKNIILEIWLLRMFALLLLRPRGFLDECFYSIIDYRRFRRSLRGFRDFINRIPPVEPAPNQPALLIVAGRAMNAQWCQIWSVLGAAYRNRYAVYVLTSKNRPIQNLYFALLGIRFIYLEKLEIASIRIPDEISCKFNQLQTFQAFKDFELDDIPLGKMALSTFSRLRATGIMDIENSESKQEVRGWLAHLYRTLVMAEQLYKQRNIEMLFFTEVFMEEYGALYYAALKKQLNVIRFAGTVRDDAIVVQHLTYESDRTHFSSISKQSWSRILKGGGSPHTERELHQNFMDRYGARWALSKRNQPNTRIMPEAEAKMSLGVPEGRKVAVIYSHILYDTLFFNGEDIFQNYADWLVETVKAACLNPNVQWFIKVHPSNLWRGELEYFHGGKYEEVRLIEQYIGDLPDHVRLVYPDTPLSPYTWLQIADYGVTVRGTSGIELGALGKVVITAGSGRYEDVGFSVNSGTVAEYLAVLSNIHDIPMPLEEQTRLGKLFAYATFCMKPFTLDFFTPVPRAGKSTIFSSDDLVYLGNFPNELTALPAPIARFVEWSYDRDAIDFLSQWPDIPQNPKMQCNESHAE